MTKRATLIVPLAFTVLLTAFAGTVPQPAMSEGLVFSNSNSPSASTQGDKRIAIAQRLLRRLSLLKEEPSGSITPATLSAIAIFAQTNNMPPTKQVTDGLITRLRRAAWLAASAEFLAMKDKYLDAEGIREAQKILKDLGYDPGNVDGILGPGTMSAIETFQEQQQITIDGNPTRTVLMNLKRIVASNAIQFSGTLRVLNWADYIDPAVLERFEAETRIKIIYDVFNSNEELEQKLKAATVPFDVVFPSSGQVFDLAERNIIQTVDKTKLANLKNIDPKILTYIDTLDPQNKHQVPYMWGTIGLAANKVAIAKVGASGVVDSLRYVFDPTYAKKLSGCGVRVLDSASDVIPIVMIYLGLDPTSSNPADISKTEQLLATIKPWVRPISTSEYIDALASGKICVTLAFSGDAVQARKAAKNRTDVDYQIANEGGTLWFDTIAIPAHARNVTAAYQFLDFLMRPSESAAISNLIGYANANEKSAPLIDPQLLKDQSVFPTPATMQRLQVLPHVTPKAQAEFDRVWKKFAN